MDGYKEAFPSVVPSLYPYQAPQHNPGLTHEELMTLLVMHALLSNTNFALHNVDEIGQSVKRVVESMRRAV